MLSVRRNTARPSLNEMPPERPPLVDGLRILYDLLKAGPNAAWSACDVAISFCSKFAPLWYLLGMLPLTRSPDLFNQRAFGEVDAKVPLFMNHLSAALCIYCGDPEQTTPLTTMLLNDDANRTLLPIGVAALCMFFLKQRDFVQASVYYNRLQRMEHETPSSHCFSLQLEGYRVFFPTRAPAWYEKHIVEEFKERDVEPLLLDFNVFGLE